MQHIESIREIGRGERIRTSDHLNPIQALSRHLAVDLEGLDNVLGQAQGQGVQS